MLVSVIIPNYNNEKYIEQCISSVCKQTLDDMEIILVDDCSKDGSVEMIRHYQEKDDRIRLLLQEQNHGVSHARNYGLSEAKGKYVTFLDGDDFYYDSRKLEREIACLESKGDTSKVIAYSGVCHVDETGERIKAQPKGKSPQGKCFIKMLSTTNTSVLPRDYCIDRETLLQTGGYCEDMQLYEDYELLLRLSKTMRFYRTDGIGTAYRIKSFGLSSRPQEEAERVLRDIYIQYLGKVSEPLKSICKIKRRCNQIYRRGIGRIANILKR